MNLLARTLPLVALTCGLVACAEDDPACPLGAGTALQETTLQAPACAAASLPGVTLAGVRIERGNFDDAVLTDLTTTGGALFFVDAEAADLSGASFTGTQLVDVDFERANLTGVTWVNVYGRGTNFGGATLDQASITAQAQLRSQFVAASFAYASLRDAELYKLLLINADFRGVDATGASLRCNDMSNARLSSANLTNADLSYTYIGRDRAQFLTDIVWDNTTCPDGTNSDDNGGTCLGHLHFFLPEGACEPLPAPT